MAAGQCGRPRSGQEMTASVSDLDRHVVGRRRELEQLAGALNDSARQGGRCALVDGVPGVGKSTLMHGFGSEVSGRGALFAYGRFQEGARVPYSALGDAFGALVQ